MLRRTFVMVLAVGFCASATAQDSSTWKINAEKSKIEFVGTKPDGKHAGGFKKISGVAEVNATPEESKLRLEIDTTSIFSDNEMLTNHLKSQDFFNVRKHPKITLESTKIAKVDGEDHKVKLSGKLTMLEATEPIELTIAASPDPGNENLVRLTTEFSIDRTKFGMTYGQGKVDNKVSIKAELVLEKE